MEANSPRQRPTTIASRNARHEDVQRAGQRPYNQISRRNEQCLAAARKNAPMKESLILTGPNRGLALSCDDYVETDLWVKDHQGHCREFSKGVLTIWGVVHRPVKECKVERVSLATRLSTVDVIYAVVKNAVEATIAVEVLQGNFHGTITAHTASIKKSLVLYDSKVAGGNCHGVIQLMRAAVSVSVKDMLIIYPKTPGGISAGLKCTPRCNGGDEIVFPLGDVLMRLKVAWSIMEP